MKVRIANIATAADVERWFDDALSHDQKRSDNQVFERLADEFKVLVNRFNNDLSRQDDPDIQVASLNDVSPAEENHRRLAEFARTGSVALVAIHDALECSKEVESLIGSHPWGFGIEELEEKALALNLLLIQAGARPELANSASAPKLSWHGPARHIARLIRDALKHIGQTKLSARNADSFTTIISTAAVNKMFSANVSPEGFATAMRRAPANQASKSEIN